MGQDEVYQFFRDKDVTHPGEYFGRVDVEKSLKEKGICTEKTRIQLNKLYAFGYLEIEIEGIWKRRYRLKKKAASLKEIIHPLSPKISSEDYRKLT